VSNTANNQSKLESSSEIEGIASDKSSGAAEILRRAGGLFSLLWDCHRDKAPTVEDAQRAVIETCIELVRAQPDMCPLMRLASAVVSTAFEAGDGAQALSAAKNAALKFVDRSASNAGLAALHASRMVHTGAGILTHSRSSTVIKALTEARRAGKDFSVFATESRPLCEGRSLAKALAGEGIHVALIADASASLVIDRVDIIFVGADKITPEYLVNKIGTSMIALAARERGVPVYAVCDSSKLIAKDYFASPRRNEERAGELWPDAPSGVTVSNFYFERIPLTWITGIITEEGALSSLEAARRASEATLDKVLEESIRNRCDDEDSNE
jgi:ribose 1,5-bisphosphate isomerase